MLYLFKGCGKCCGDLVQEGDEWRCFQCGHVYYPKRSEADLMMDRELLDRSMTAGDKETAGGAPIVRRSARHLNPIITAARIAEQSWWDKNRQVISHLDEGKKVREIAELVGKGPRQIRVVRERLRDLRSDELELVGAD